RGTDPIRDLPGRRASGPRRRRLIHRTASTRPGGHRDGGFAGRVAGGVPAPGRGVLDRKRIRAMFSKLSDAVVSRARSFHTDEAGDSIQAIAVGAVGVLLASIIFQTMSQVVKGGGNGGTGGAGGGGGLSGLFSGFLGTMSSGVTSLLGI